MGDLGAGVHGELAAITNIYAAAVTIRRVAGNLAAGHRERVADRRYAALVVRDRAAGHLERCCCAAGTIKLHADAGVVVDLAAVHIERCCYASAAVKIHAAAVAGDGAAVHIERLPAAYIHAPICTAFDLAGALAVGQGQTPAVNGIDANHTLPVCACDAVTVQAERDIASDHNSAFGSSSLIAGEIEVTAQIVSAPIKNIG